MAGRNPTRSLLLRRNNQYADLRVPARGRGGVQVLERLGPESAQNLYSPAAPRAMQAQHKARNATNVFLLVFNSEEARHAQKKNWAAGNNYFIITTPFNCLGIRGPVAGL